MAPDTQQPTRLPQTRAAPPCPHLRAQGVAVDERLQHKGAARVHVLNLLGSHVLALQLEGTADRWGAVTTMDLVQK